MKGFKLSLERKELISRIRSDIIKQDTALGILLLYLEYLSIDVDEIAYTDGKYIYLGKLFWDLKVAYQKGIIVHELLHIALGHCFRANRVSSKVLWNIATDSIINNSLKYGSYELPPGVMDYSKIIKQEDLKDKVFSTWTSEDVYNYLIANSIKGSYILSDDIVGGLTSIELETELDVWKHRIDKANQFNGQDSSLIRSVIGDIQKSTIPWENILRRFAISNSLETDINYSSPSRRTLSMTGSDYFDFADRHKESITGIGVVVDTSGSIDGPILDKFISEICSIQKQTNSTVTLITCDAAVHDIYKLANDGRSLVNKMKDGSIKFKGGSGTSFVPALEVLKKEKVRVGVYLTDLFGNFGNDTKMPFELIWCSTTRNKAPFGKTLYIGE